MSASFTTLVGRASAASSAPPRSKRSQATDNSGELFDPGPETVAKLEADRIRPLRTIPGKPTATRSKAGSGATSRASAATRASGGQG